MIDCLGQFHNLKLQVFSFESRKSSDSLKIIRHDSGFENEAKHCANEAFILLKEGGLILVVFAR